MFPQGLVTSMIHLPYASLWMVCTSSMAHLTVALLQHTTGANNLAASMQALSCVRFKLPSALSNRQHATRESSLVLQMCQVRTSLPYA